MLTWEQQYLSYLRNMGRLRPQTEQELKRCTDEAFRAINPTAGPHEFSSGVIVGPVQAGKTGLMISLTARALDIGFRVVVVLAGLKDDLRTQTAFRYINELLQRGDKVPGAPGSFTHPLGEGYHGSRDDCWAPLYYEDVNRDDAFVHLVCGHLRRGKKILAVTKKNVSTLNRLRDALESASSQEREGRLPILVLDDECDEASVSGDPDAPTPERIAALWSSIPQYIAYIGFTATPAANLLQESSSSLFPRTFVLSMRAPGDQDSTLTYLEPDFDRRHIGGYAYYEFMETQQKPNFLVSSAMTDEEYEGRPGEETELEEALIAYFVSGAIRLAMQPMCDLDNPQRLPRPHTMMAHTESGIEDHWKLCERVARLTKRMAGKPDEVHENLRVMAPKRRLKSEDLESWLRMQGERWRSWYEHFKTSREVLFQIVPDRDSARFPSWDEIQPYFANVFNHVQLRVVNSDESSSDKPLQFYQTYSSEGTKPPSDIYSIIIGGNRLSRGLTIEGLCISYYTRSPNQFSEDTAIQRERWFGYRGSFLEFCRLFTHRSLAIRLRRFHEHDDDLRRQLAWNIRNGRTPLGATYRFLTTRDSRPTAKLGRGGLPAEIEVSGVKPFVDRVQMGNSPEEIEVARANQGHAYELATRVLQEGEELRSLRGELQGYVTREIPAGVIAAYLDGFRYTFHNPDPARGVAWNLKEDYRAPDQGIGITSPGMPPRSDPFLIAAYLRYWQTAFEICHADPSRNLFRDADTISRWQPCPAPKFNLAVRVGSLRPDTDSPFRFELLNRAVDSSGLVGARWGGRGYGSYGDEWIDMTPPEEDGDAPRQKNAVGLFLLHIIGRDARGRDGLGSPYVFDRPCVGLVIPIGGPCIRFVLAEEPG